MRVFDVFKRRFKKESKDMHMDLKGPLASLDIPDKVNKGEITITK
jgi:hypothetical protein